MDKEEDKKDQEDRHLYIESRLRRLTNLLNHMKKEASSEAQIVDFDAALDYVREALSELI